MDIYKYFKSKAVAEHCKKIGHVFSPLDMAVIVALSDKTIKKKHLAYRDIIANYHDMSVKARLHIKARKSLHNYLLELIAYEEKLLTVFGRAKPKDIYFASIWITGYKDYTGAFVSNTHKDFENTGEYYSTLERALIGTVNYCKKNEYEVERIRIFKRNIDTENGVTVYADFDKSGDPLNTQGLDTKYSGDHVENIFIDIPIPFVKGDLVSLFGEPYVFSWSPHMEKAFYKDAIKGKRCDSSDMICYLYFMQNGNLVCYHGAFDHRPGHFLFYDLEYYDESMLTGQDKFLKHLSPYIKKDDKQNALCCLMYAYDRYKREYELNQLIKVKEFDCGYYFDKITQEQDET